jgi:hypothetical protein
LLAPPYPLLVIGVKGVPTDPGRSVTFAVGSEQCIIDLLPAMGTATTLPDEPGFEDETIAYPTCQTDPELPTADGGRSNNILLGQTITLSLNVRYDGELGGLDLCRYMSSLAVDCDGDGCCGRPPICPENDDVPIPDTYYDGEIKGSVFEELTALGWGSTVDDLLALANYALAGGSLTHTSLFDINSAVDAINKLFDKCRYLDYCADDPRPTDVTIWGTVSSAKAAGSVPYEYSLDQNYPNPFNAGTQITYGLAEDANVDLAIYNILGQRVVTLESGHREAGYHTVAWDGRDRDGDEVASGMYFYRIKAGDLIMSKKMVLLK